MDIFKQWHKLEEEKFNQSPIKREDIMNAIYEKSTSTIEELKTRLKYKMAWILFFILCFLSLMIWQLNNLPAAMIFAGAAILYGVGFLGLRRYYLKMGLEYENRSTLSIMKDNYKLITGALNFESNIFMVVGPSIFIGAMLVPGLIDGKSISEIISNPKFLIVGAIALVAVAPLVKMLGDKLNKVAYGSYIDNLNSNIRDMEKVG